MKPSLYLETTIPSYLTAKQSRDIIQTARQQITIEWWDNRLNDFDIYISQTVIDEASAGDFSAAQRRMEVIKKIPMLEITEEITKLAERLLKEKVIPEKGLRDAIHIAISAYHGINFLLTWNCKHIANAEKIKLIENICREEGYELPVICTPDELLER